MLPLIAIEKKTFAERFHRSTRHQETEPCRNCGTQYIGNYCPDCGQEAHTGAPTALAFIYEFLTRNVFERGKLPRTIWHLVRYPGGLTVDFLEGRRQRFIRPVRLYIGLSILYFLLLSFLSSAFSERISLNNESIKVQETPENRSKEKAELEKVLKKMQTEGVPPVARAVLQSRIDSLALPEEGRAATRDAKATTGDAKTTTREGKAATKQADKSGNQEAADLDEQEQDFDLRLDFLEKMPDTGTMGVLKKRMLRFMNLPKSERNTVLLQGMLNQAPKAMFFLVPVFAMLLKLLFLFQRIPYGAHLLFAFHYHSLVFLGLLLLFLPMPDVVIALLPVWMWFYLALAMRRTYMCGWFSAMFRLCTLSILYSIAISLALMAAAAAAVLL